MCEYTTVPIIGCTFNYITLSLFKAKSLNEGLCNPFNYKTYSYDLGEDLVG